jgi:hypothetical protein
MGLASGRRCTVRCRSSPGRIAGTGTLEAHTPSPGPGSTPSHPGCRSTPVPPDPPTGIRRGFERDARPLLVSLRSVGCREAELPR